MRQLFLNKIVTKHGHFKKIFNKIIYIKDSKLEIIN